MSGTIRIGHHAADAILNTIDQYDADAVLPGWSGTGSRRRDIVLGSTVDAVVRNASCDVLIERTRGEETTGEVGSVVLPTAGGPHAELAAEVAATIARAEGATVRVVNVVSPDALEAKRSERQAIVDDAVASLEAAGVEAGGRSSKRRTWSTRSSRSRQTAISR